MTRKTTTHVCNESGYVLVGALLMLAFLSIIGISASSTADLETQIAGNDKYYKSKLYVAEGAAMEIMQRLENDDPDVLVDRTQKSYLNRGNIKHDLDEGVRDTDNLVAEAEGETVSGANALKVAFADDAMEDGVSANVRALGENGQAAGTSEDTIAKGDSLQSMTQSGLHSYVVIGNYRDNHVSITIEAGYQKRF